LRNFSGCRDRCKIFSSCFFSGQRYGRLSAGFRLCTLPSW
jgi:hypothetical protein